MKKTFLAFLTAGSVAAFAQTTPTTPTTTPTTSPTTTSPTTTTPTTPTTSPTTTTPSTQTSTSVDPMNTTSANGQLNTNSVNYWTPSASPNWGWNNYGVWNGSSTSNLNNTAVVNSNINTAGTTSVNGSTSMNGSMSTDASMNNSSLNTSGNGSLNSSSNYSAYSTSVTALPPNVQNNFSRDFPTNMNNTYSWNQYGDWFHTQYMSNGRSTHYYYDMRGNGYALALPVIQTYVPEDIIDKALQRYGSNLYSISMVKTHDGDAYAVGLIERGQLRTEYLKEDGSAIANIWRVEEQTMNTTDANAAMDTQNNMNTTTIQEDEKETKVKWKENGVKTKIKSGDGKLKIKQKKVDD